MMTDESAVTMGVRLYERQLTVLDEIDQGLGGVGRSAVLRRLIDEYADLGPIRNVVEACKRGFISHELAVQSFAEIVKQDGGGGA